MLVSTSFANNSRTIIDTENSQETENILNFRRNWDFVQGTISSAPQKKVQRTKKNTLNTYTISKNSYMSN